MRLKRRTKKVISKLNKLLPYLCFTLLGFFAYKYIIRTNQLKRSGKLITGKVIEFRGDYRGEGGTVLFSYMISGRAYNNTNGFPNIYTSEGHRLVNKEFPVMYDSSNAKNSRILITTKDFKDFDIEFPDSLQWVKAYEK